MNLRLALYCLLGGLCFTIAALGVGHFGLWWLAGILVTASLAPVARFGARHPLAQFGAIALITLVIGLVCTLSEAVLFVPELKAQLLTSLTGGIVMYLIVSAVLAALARVLKLTEPAGQAVEHRPVAVAIPMVLLSGLSYVVYYLIFGLIIYEFITKQYYPHARETAAALGVWFWLYQWARGTLMTLAVLPVIYTLRLRRWHAALAAGAIIWIAGGGAALLVPNANMVTAQRFAHILEVMTQNVPLGITAVLLLRPKAAKGTTSTQSAPAA